MRVAIYTCVSVADTGHNATDQCIQLRDYCSAQGYTIVQEYEDQASGRDADRVEFQRMLRNAATRRFDLLLFWGLDQFTREGTLSTLKYLEFLESQGIRWRSLTESWIDSAGPFRDVVINLLASFVKQEQIRISERVRGGMDRAKTGGTKSGRPIGRPPVVFPSDQVAGLRMQGLSWGKIARQLGVSKTSVRRAVQ